MKNNIIIRERAVELGKYIVEHNSTVRAVAKDFKVSKSTVYVDLTSRLKDEDAKLYKDVREVLNKNTDERHIRGGEATKRKYLSLKKK